MTGECAACGESFRLYPDGRLKNHGPLGRPCDGSGQPAVGHEPAEPEGLYGRLVTPSPAWHRQAACRPELRPAGVSPAEWTGMFFPTRGAALTEARRVCLDCPVRDDCLTTALSEGEKHGVWGGASERTRRSLRRRNAA